MDEDKIDVKVGKPSIFIQNTNLNAQDSLP